MVFNTQTTGTVISEQSVSQSVSQTFRQSVNQSVCSHSVRSGRQSVSRSVSPSISQFVIQSASQPASEPVTESVIQSVGSLCVYYYYNKTCSTTHSATHTHIIIYIAQGLSRLRRKDCLDSVPALVGGGVSVFRVIRVEVSGQ